jgi:hypothetical protein
MGDLIRFLFLIALFVGIWFLLSRAQRRAEAKLQRLQTLSQPRPLITSQVTPALSSTTSTTDTELYDGEAIADTIVYYAYGPGKEELRKAKQEVLAALKACGPSWHSVATITAHLPLRQLTEDHGIGLASLLDAGQVEARPPTGAMTTPGQREYRVL